jgi:acyl-CoA thioesterase-1
MDTRDNYKFVLYGDSISKGVAYDEINKKYVLLENSFANLLRDKLKGVIFNVGRFGNTLVKAAGKLQNDVLRRNPDIVIVEFGGNDCDFDWEKVADAPDAHHEPKTEYNKFLNLLKSLIETLEKANIVPVLLNLPPVDADRYFKWISKNSTYMGERILKWLGSVCKIYWWQERYNSAILDIADETGTRLIDIRSPFLKYPDYREFICADGIHPNEKGHRLIADKIIEYVKLNYDFLLRE